MDKIDFVIPAYDRPHHLMVMLAGLMAQTNPNWRAQVVFDGAAHDRHRDVVRYVNGDSRILFLYLPKRYNDWGHTPRNVGLSEAVCEWVVMTGEDNYYVPTFVENILRMANETVNLIYCNMLHNWTSDQYVSLFTVPKTGAIDIGCCVYRTSMAKTMCLDVKDKCADGAFVEKFVGRFGGAVKIEKTLYVHN